ncbi:MAG: hypothetical protein AAGK00_15605 [Pseudomonadota bacterium]
MTRGWFLAGLIGLAFFFFLVLAFIGLVEQRTGALTSPVLADKYAAILAYWLACWFLLFPALCRLLRGRLIRRRRPLWWADTPGILAFLSIGIFGVMFLLLLSGFDFPKVPGRSGPIIIGIILFGPTSLGLLIAFALIIECLRPDWSQDTTDVFD